MKYALNFPNFGDYSNPRELAELALDAEKAGWDGFFLWDHMTSSSRLTSSSNIPFVDPWVALSAIAMKTESISIGTWITPLPRRRPWKLARETVSIDHLSNGRLILGVGLGAPDYEFIAYGEDVDPRIRAQKLDEGLKILIGLWSGKPFKFKGKYFNLKEVTFLPKPVNEHIPIWVAGMWPNKKPFQRAAQYDGVCPINANYPKELTPQDIRDIIKYVENYREGSKKFDVIIAGQTPLDSERGAEIVKPYAEAGATWWNEYINSWRGSFKEMQDRIRKGPPKF